MNDPMPKSRKLLLAVAIIVIGALAGVSITLATHPTCSPEPDPPLTPED